MRSFGSVGRADATEGTPLRRSGRPGAKAGLVCALLATVVAALHSQSSDPATLYQQALRRETVLRQEMAAARPGAPGGIVLERIRVLIGSYEDMARLFAASNTGDDSLSHAGLLAADAFTRFGQSADRDTALRILKSLPLRFPASPLLKEGAARVRSLEGARTVPQAANAAPAPTAASIPTPAPAPASTQTSTSTPAPASPASAIAKAPADKSAIVMLRAIRREALPDTLRVTLELDREVAFHDERIEGPPRVFVDLPNTRAVDALKDATIPYPDGPVKQVRVGRQLNSRTRVVLDLNGAGSHSVYAVYNPYRIVIDIERPAASAASLIPTERAPIGTRPVRAPLVMASNASKSAPSVAVPQPRETS